jgi:hypothetical protein
MGSHLAFRSQPRSGRLSTHPSKQSPAVEVMGLRFRDRIQKSERPVGFRWLRGSAVIRKLADSFSDSNPGVPAHRPIVSFGLSQEVSSRVPAFKLMPLDACAALQTEDAGFPAPAVANYCERLQSAGSQTECAFGMPRLMPKALPDCRWHSLQWHTARPTGLLVTSYLTYPH